MRPRLATADRGVSLSPRDQKREFASRTELEQLAGGKWRLTQTSEGHDADVLLGIPAVPPRYLVERLGLADSRPHWEASSATEALGHAQHWETAQSRLKPEFRAKPGDNDGVPEIIVQHPGATAQERRRREQIARGESAGSIACVIPSPSPGPGQ